MATRKATPRKAPPRKAAPRKTKAAPAPTDRVGRLEAELAEVKQQVHNLALFIATGIAQQQMQQQAAQGLAGQLLNGTPQSG